jgi:iron complex outermembrane receptor protein
MKQYLGAAASGLSVAIACMSLPSAALAQEAGAAGEPAIAAATETPAATEGTIVVTGSRLRRPSSDGASPLSVTDREALQASGQASLGNVVANLTINTGSQFNTDLQGQGGTVGTAGFNLRGLGLNSTLVLLNGNRSVEYAVNNNVGDTFVDVNSLIPQIAIERIDILKDGAAALYGSDAVAGVANFITRRKLDGVELQAEMQDVARGAQREYIIAGIVGGGNDRFRGLLAIQYSDRGLLSTGEQPRLTSGRDISPLSQPGSFIPLARLPLPGGGSAYQPVGGPQPDPLCGDPRVGGLPSAQVPGLCSGDFSAFNTLVPAERRLNAYAELSYEPSDGVRLSADVGFSRSTSEALGYPGNPLLFFPFVPANNPGNTFVYTSAFGPPGSGQFIGDRIPTLFLGRAFGPLDQGVTYVFKHNLYRGGLNASFDVGHDWQVDFHYGFGRSEAESDRPDLDRAELIRSLNGQGGPNGNLFFNPFANARLAAPGTPQYNDPAVIDAIKVISTERLTRTLHDVVLSANGDVFALPGGNAALAAGGAIRWESINGDYSDIANRDGLAFFLGDPDFRGSRQVYSLFGELGLPVADKLDVQLAGRFEHYPTGSSFNPKIGLVYKPSDAVTLRGSWGTSFRAPNLFQLFGFTTGVEGVDDALTGQSNTNPSIRTVRNGNLANENSTAWSFGVDLIPVPRLRFSVDYWRFDFKDRIVRDVAQQAVNADVTSRLAGGPGDPRVIRNPETLGISRIDLSFINAAGLKTDGMDIALTYTIPTENVGRFVLSADATRVFSYDIQQSTNGPVISGNGQRNFVNFGVSSPKLRGNLGVAWDLDQFGASLTGRYISSYLDDRTGGRLIGDNFTLDAQLSVGIGDSKNRMKLSVGAINLFDQMPPAAVGQQGFDATVHDPRGRVFYAKLQASF